MRISRSQGALLVLSGLLWVGCSGPDKETVQAQGKDGLDKTSEPSSQPVPAGALEAATGGARVAKQSTPQGAAASPDPRALPTIDRLPDPRTIADSPKGLINGDFAPELDHLDLSTGKQFKLSSLVGPEASDPRGAVVVSFTASWCGPCRASLPYLKKMEEDFPRLDVVLVTMDEHKAGRDKELAQLRASGLQAPLLVPDSHTLRAWLGRKRNIPHLYILNQAGEVLVQDRGFGNKVRKVLPKQIRYALSHPDYVVRARKVR